MGAVAKRLTLSAFFPKSMKPNMSVRGRLLTSSWTAPSSPEMRTVKVSPHDRQDTGKVASISPP